MSSSAIDLAALSRKELQALAKEFQLCRGNAKSDVILQHVERFVAENPADGEARVRAVLGGSAAEEAAPLKSESPHEVPTATKASPKADKTVTPRKNEDAAKPESATKATPETKAAKKSPAKAGAAAPTAAKAKTPEKKTPEKKAAATTTTTSPAPKKSPAKAEAAVPSAKQTPPAKKAHKSPAKDASSVAAKSPAKQSATSGRPVLASLDANVAKSKKQTAATVDSLVNATDDLAFIGDGSRVRCSTTGHEFKADVGAIDAYLRGKSYQRAKLKKQSFAAFAPMFVAHPDEKKAPLLLWCSVTETEHPRDVARIEAHIAGSRYQKELPQWQKAEAARAQAKQEAAARAAAKAQARAARLQQLEAEASKQRKQAKKSRSKRSRDAAATKAEETAAEAEATRPRKKQAAAKTKQH